MLYIGGLIPSTIATTVANSDLYFVWCPSILEVYIYLIENHTVFQNKSQNKSQNLQNLQQTTRYQLAIFLYRLLLL